MVWIIDRTKPKTEKRSAGIKSHESRPANSVITPQLPAAPRIHPHYVPSLRTRYCDYYQRRIQNLKLVNYPFLIYILYFVFAYIYSMILLLYSETIG